jgi:hypothetical protein
MVGRSDAVAAGTDHDDVVRPAEIGLQRKMSFARVVLATQALFEQRQRQSRVSSEIGPAGAVPAGPDSCAAG